MPGRSVKRVIVLIIAFLSVPYLFDVAFYGDFTPTHFAQETTVRADSDGPDDHSLASGGAQGRTIAVVAAGPPVPRPLTRGVDLLIAAVFRFSHLPSASLISRPPPISAIV
ncbi:MAG TPA: hypothetical protein VJ746_16115 [Nitrospira sp.]|nr:hypothetical protein [Nitrospira sp.]